MQFGQLICLAICKHTGTGQHWHSVMTVLTRTRQYIHLYLTSSRNAGCTRAVSLTLSPLCNQVACSTK